MHGCVFSIELPLKLNFQLPNMVKCPECLESVEKLVLLKKRSMCPECKEHFVAMQTMRDYEEESSFESMECEE